jgi:hypothetical protein
MCHNRYNTSRSPLLLVFSACLLLLKFVYSHLFREEVFVVPLNAAAAAAEHLPVMG